MAWSSRQLARLKRTFDDALFELPIEPPWAAGRPWPAILADRLLDGRDEKLPWPHGLSFVSASGLDSECRAIARWAKAHLAAGERPEDLAIVARDIAPYRPVLAHVFAETGRAAPACPSPWCTATARLLMALVREADGLGYADVLTVLSSSYFRPSALGDFSAEAPLAARLLVRHGNVLEGREPYAHACQWLAGRIERFEAQAAEDDELASPIDNQLRRVAPRASPRRAACWKPCSTGSSPSPPAARWPSSLPRHSGL